MDENVRIGMAEALGTAILVIGGCGTAVFAADAVGVLGVATAFGLSLLVMAYTIGPISGCHINPAVTIGLIVAKKVEAAKAPFYIGGQLVGGLVGGALLYLVFQLGDVEAPASFATNGFGEFSPGGYALGGVALAEILMTALLLLGVLGTLHRNFPPAAGGIAAGFTLWLIHLISIPISNTSVNPARSLAVAPFAEGNDALIQVWAFFVFPIIGAALGAGIWLFLTSGDPVAE